MVSIRDLDFDLIKRQIARNTDRIGPRGYDGLITDQLARAKGHGRTSDLLRSSVMHAALRHTRTLEELTIDKPLIEALVRVLHHPLVRPVPAGTRVQESMNGPDCAFFLNDLAAAHPELSWDPRAVEALILRDLRETHGGHVVNDDQLPWVMYWGPASNSAHALFMLVTLEELGAL